MATSFTGPDPIATTSGATARKSFADGQFFPDLMVTEATEFITNHRDEPFFLYFAMNVPHYPLQGEADWLEHYSDLPYPRESVCGSSVDNG